MPTRPNDPPTDLFVARAYRSSGSIAPGLLIGLQLEATWLQQVVSNPEIVISITTMGSVKRRPGRGSASE